MADSMTVKDEGVKFKPHPDGQHILVCVDTIDLGERVDGGGVYNKPMKLTRKGALVFMSGLRNPDNGEYFEVSAEFTLSMYERAGLRKFLEDWRGRKYTDEEAKRGVPIDKLVNRPCLATIEHKMSAKQRVYAVIRAVQGVPASITIPPIALDAVHDYKRGDYWEDRKKMYAMEASKFRAESGSASHDEQFEPQPDDDDLPF